MTALLAVDPATGMAVDGVRMHFFSILALFASASPDLVAGPDSAEAAQLIDAPIAEVTVFSDRARMMRRAKLDLGKGVRLVRLPDLKGSILLDSPRLTVTPGKVLRVEISPVMRDRISLDQVDAWIEELEGLSDEIAVIDATTAVLADDLELLSEIEPMPPVPEEKREGRPPPSIVAEVWRRSMDFLSGARDRNREKLRELAVQRRGKLEKIEALQKQIQRLNLGAFSDRMYQVFAILEVPGGVTTLELEYFATGASWRPAYDLHFDPASQAVRLETAGAVSQATGESWDEVSLSLSTAIPGQSIALPKLLTWTLGEAKEFIPRVFPRTPRTVTPAASTPAALPSRAETERAMRLDRAQERLGALNTLASANAEELVESKKVALEHVAKEKRAEERPRPSAATGFRGSAQSRERLDRSGPSAPRKAQAISESYDAAPSAPMERDYMLSVTAADEEGASSASGASVALTPLSLFEPAPATRIQFTDPSLPAVLAGGLDFVFRSATRANIDSAAANVRVPLASETYPVRTRYRASPGIEPVAFLEATIVNKGNRPILGGPVQIFSRGGFVADGNIATTGAGGKIVLPLGADQDVGIKRRVVANTASGGILSKTEKTTYKVITEIANRKKQRIEIAIREPLPTTSSEDIEIELVSFAPIPNTGPDREGILEWILDVEAGKVATIELDYTIERPARWQLHQ